MSLESRITALAQAIGADIKTLLSRSSTLSFSFPGSLSLYTGQGRWYNSTGRTLTIQAARASVGTTPTGASILVDVNKNGTTIFTTQSARPTIAASSNDSGKATPAVTSLADGDYITIDIDQIGSTVAGSDLIVEVLVV